jgi:hypothetical protein
MRVFLALIFLSHGIAALKMHPVYVDYIIGFSFSLSNSYLSQQSAENLLIAIGILDIISAVALVLFLKKPLLYWFIVWGFVTAFLRIVDAGWMNFPEFLIRAPHFFIPILLLLGLYKSERKNPA